MTNIHFDGQYIELEPDESVLDALIRHGHDIPHGCRAGACQACVMASDKAEGLNFCQQGLNDAQKALNYFLSCQCQPTNSMAIKRVADAGRSIDTEVLAKDWLNDSVIRLRLKAPFDYLPGQYITLWKNANIARSYSLASHPKLNDYLELHIKYIDNGELSTWVAKDVKLGDKLKIQGPIGHCVYSAKNDQPLLLAAIGTGLAPIYGILQDALVNDHIGDIQLIVGAAQLGNYYMIDDLLNIANEYKQVNTHFIVQEESNSGFAEQGNIYDFCKNLIPNMQGYHIYLCGADSFVKKMRKNCFLAGASMSDISADSFVACS